MTPLHKSMQARYSDPDLEALREWQTPQGYLGTYCSRGKYLYLALLTRKHVTVTVLSYHPDPDLLKTMMMDAEAIATFAGAILLDQGGA